MYSLPQEIEVWYIIPAIRKELAKLLSKKYNLTYERIGEILGISKAAVSQYLNKKRATKISFPKKIKEEIKKAGKRIVKDNNQAVKEIIKLLDLIKNSGCQCEICQKYNKGILKKCRKKPIKRK